MSYGYWSSLKSLASKVRFVLIGFLNNLALPLARSPRVGGKENALSLRTGPRRLADRVSQRPDDTKTHGACPHTTEPPHCRRTFHWDSTPRLHPGGPEQQIASGTVGSKAVFIKVFVVHGCRLECIVRIITGSQTPLPDVAQHIHHTERRGTIGEDTDGATPLGVMDMLVRV